MGIVTPPPQPARLHPSPPKPYSRALAGPDSSMSQGFNQGIFSFSDGFDRSASQEQQQHIAQQSRRDKLRVQGFDPVSHHLVPIEEEGEEPSGIYEPPVAANMLSDLFNFPTAGPSATELLANQIPGGYRLAQRPISVAGFSGDWYGSNRQGGVVLSTSGLSSIGDAAVKHHHDSSGHAMPGLNADSAAAMQLFLMNPPAGAASHPAPPRSPSPPPAPPPHPTLLHHQAFQQAASFGDTSFGGGVVEGQGLSLSLSSSLRQFEVAKAEDPRVRDALLYFNARQQHHVAQGQHGQQGEGHGQLHMGYGAAGVLNVLRTSKYARPAQELLEEFCSVGRGQHKGSRIGRHHRGGSSNPNPNPGGRSGGGASSSAAAASSSSKDPPPLSPADRFEHQRKKAKLLSMLDEVDRRYNHYCDQMQIVVNSFDSVMGFGAATPYTALAQKAMSRHFRCLKDSVAAQLRQTCELLGEKDGASSSGITKGETPRLKMLDQSLRQQRAFHQMGMMEQEAWRPQRGLPERSVNILRAWLFEHFLHPYPSDADKLFLARQTGLSRNQVSNWFINARVRLWKPMVEEMYQQEAKEEEGDGERAETSHQRAQSPTSRQQQKQQRPETNAPESDPSRTPPPTARPHRFSASENPSAVHQSGEAATELCGPDVHVRHGVAEYGAASAAALGPASLMRFGMAGDVSLTLGLRHASNAAGPEQNQFSVRDFGNC